MGLDHRKLLMWVDDKRTEGMTLMVLAVVVEIVVLVSLFPTVSRDRYSFVNTEVPCLCLRNSSNNPILHGR